MSDSSTYENPYSICGLVGALIFPLSLLPSVYKAIRTRSTEDISYVWQALFLSGLIMTAIYAAKYRLWVVLWPLVIEISFMLLLIILKVYYDNCKAKSEGRANEVQVMESGTMDRTEESSQRVVEL